MGLRVKPKGRVHATIRRSRGRLELLCRYRVWKMQDEFTNEDVDCGQCLARMTRGTVEARFEA